MPRDRPDPFDVDRTRRNRADWRRSRPWPSRLATSWDRANCSVLLLTVRWCPSPDSGDAQRADREGEIRSLGPYTPEPGRSRAQLGEIGRLRCGCPPSTSRRPAVSVGSSWAGKLIAEDLAVLDTEVGRGGETRYHCISGCARMLGRRSRLQAPVEDPKSHRGSEAEQRVAKRR